MSDDSPAAALDARAGQAPATRPLTAVALTLAALVLLPLMDGIAKHLSGPYPLGEVVWARYFFHLAAMLPVLLWRFGPRALWPRRIGVQVLRGGMLLGATALFFAAIDRMPLADALALFFVSPLVVTALAPLLLGEAVGMPRRLAVLGGFLGVVVILRPGSGAFEWAALLALGSGTVHGLYLLATRKLSGTAPPLVTLAYTALVGAVVMSLVVPAVWVPPAPRDLGLMASMGVLAALGHFLLIKALDYAPASLLAPFAYGEIVVATLVGYVLFGDLPDPWTWTGIAVIAASGVYVSVHERRVLASVRGRP